MWHSEADIMNDLAALNDFGDPGDTEPYKILCSIGRGSKTKRKPKKSSDSVTEEEFKSSEGHVKMEDELLRGKGRGSVLDTRNYVLLQKQLRLARPLGSSDKLIESCYPKSTPPKEDVACKDPEHTIEPQEYSDESSTPSTSKVNYRIKGMRSSNVLSNALMANLLKSKEIPATGEKLMSENVEGVSDPNKPFSLPTGEDPSLESTRVSSEMCTKEEILGEMKDSGGERRKPFRLDLTGNVCSNIDFIEKEDIIKGGVKNVIQSSSDSENSDERDIEEQYRKLGERLNRMEMVRRREREGGVTGSSSQSGSTSKWTEAVNVDTKELLFDYSNFPPLVRKK